MIQIEEIDYDAATRIAKHGRYYPGQALPLPEQGTLLAIDGGLLAFAGQDGKNDGFVFGISERPESVWHTAFIEDYSKGDLYCRFVQFEQAGTVALPEGEGKVCLPDDSADERFLPLVIRVVYEHDVHDHSHASALATTTVRLALESVDRGFSLLDITLDKTPSLNTPDAIKMQPGDFQAVGAVGLEKFRSHLLSQFSRDLFRLG